MIHGMRYSEADQIAIGQAIEYGDGRSATERVSHGICPECLGREFPEMVKEAVGSGG